MNIFYYFYVHVEVSDLSINYGQVACYSIS